MSLRCRCRSPQLSVATLMLVLVSSCAWSAHAEPSKDPEKIRLVVLVVFDQLRGDYLKRWGDLFGAGGFRRLMDEGAWFTNCHYPYADTKTGPGHASLATGCVPSEHGIVANEWYDRQRAQLAYCVDSDRHVRVPRLPASNGSAKKAREGNVSPERLLVPGFGDLLKQATGGRARVVALSFKDRSAVLLGGAHPDACYWIDNTTGECATSTYYRDQLHPWAIEFNRSRAVDRWKGDAWSPLRSDLDYTGRSNALQAAKPFRYSLIPGGGEPWKSYYASLYFTPFGNELMLDLAQRVLEAETLGRHETPDFLAISFSANDTAGHRWGPDSPEVLDMTLRSDLIVKRLLEALDRQVGKGSYLLALSADHGICPIPEQTRARGTEAARIPIKLLSTEAEAFLRRTFGGDEKSRWLEASAEPWIYLNRGLLANRGLKPQTVETALARWLEQQPGILKAYTRTELLQGIPKGDDIGRQVARSFHPDRCGDVGVVLKPYHVFDSFLTGTTHGSPHAYDTHVPLLLYGPGIPVGVREERVAPQAIAAVFAGQLGTTAPKGAYAIYPESIQPARAARAR